MQDTKKSTVKRSYGRYTNKLRNRMVALVKNSEDKSVTDIAVANDINPSALWNWCSDKLGPRVLNRVVQRGRDLRGKKKSANAAMAKKPLKDSVKAKLGTLATSMQEVMKFADMPAACPPRLAPKAAKTPTVSITIDASGKISKYEVSGDVNVMLYSQVAKVK